MHFAGTNCHKFKTLGRIKDELRKCQKSMEWKIRVTDGMKTELNSLTTRLTSKTFCQGSMLKAVCLFVYTGLPSLAYLKFIASNTLMLTNNFL